MTLHTFTLNNSPLANPSILNNFEVLPDAVVNFTRIKFPQTRIQTLQKHDKSNWTKKYSTGLQKYLSEEGKILLKQKHMPSDCTVPEPNIKLTAHLRECYLTKFKNITEQTFSLFSWDTTIEEIPNRIPIVLLTAKTYCSCGMIKNEIIAVQSEMSEILSHIINR